MKFKLIRNLMFEILINENILMISNFCFINYVMNDCTRKSYYMQAHAVIHQEIPAFVLQ